MTGILVRMTVGHDQKQCFTSIQSRKLLGSLQSFRLCPSMDLAVYSTSVSPQQLHLFRTVSWQRVASITDEIEDVAQAVTCWSPSGRWIAVARDSTISLYGVELLANPLGGTGFSNEATDSQHSWTVDYPVKHLFWAHVGRAHPTAWRTVEDEIEVELSWSYQSLYVDTTQFFLPPSGYLQPSDEEEHHRLQEQTTTTALPESKTPLSVLCVTTAKHLELYLHGRYRLLTLDLPRKEDIFPSQVAVSNDLSYFLIQSGSSTLSLYHFPFLKRDRYPFQIIASLHASISSHLVALRTGAIECANSWRSSIRPLDAKLQPLLKLLNNYGVDDQPLGVILRQYILIGHTSESSSVANAMDQFFTSVQMNDQLLQRMERSLHGALANVESQARKGLLSPTQALCYEIQQLAGHVVFHQRRQSPELQELLHVSHQLWISVHTLLLSIVQGRLQIRDFCGWLRSAGSQVKARGTASNSVQRENAKKRRVPQAVIERLLSSLNTVPLDPTASISEHLLNISTSTLLKDTSDRVPLPLKTSGSETHPSSPKSVTRIVTNTQTVVRTVMLTTNAFQTAMINPLQNIPESNIPLDIHLPSGASSFSSVALTMRIGRDVIVCKDDWNGDDDIEDDEAQTTCFFPSACSSGDDIDEPDMCYCRQWSIVATALDNVLQLFAMPLGWKDPHGGGTQSDDLIDGVSGIPFYLSAKLVLPCRGYIRDVAFYSDDGKSSLSSGNDSGTGKEGCQKLGILYQHEDCTIDLWLASYDRILWQSIPFGSSLVDSSQLENFATWNLQPITGEEDMDLDLDQRVIPVQARNVLTLEHANDDVRLVLCGSRGVGAVSVTAGGVTTLELLDLEEDEETDDVDNEDLDEEEDDK